MVMMFFVSVLTFIVYVDPSLFLKHPKLTSVIPFEFAIMNLFTKSLFERLTVFF